MAPQTSDKRATKEPLELFDAVEKKMTGSGLQSELWYLLVQTAMVGGGDTDAVAALYLHLISRPDRETPELRRALVRRLREALVKSIIIQGIPRNIDAVLAINSVEQEQDKDHTSTRKDWRSDPEISERGLARLKRLYKGNTDDTLALFDDHEDFKTMTIDITYGLFLSDDQVLNEVEAEVVVLTGILMQNLPVESHWHTRAFRRIGASKEDTQTLVDCVKLVAQHYGLKLDKIAKVEDVDSEV